jgi:protein-S-isoprenylcysteine O-methyltransferase Ste14
MSLKKRAWLNTAIFIPTVCLLIFLPAGTFAYWQAWVLLALMVLTGAVISAYFRRKDPELLERRMRVREKERPQKVIAPLLYALLATTLVVASLDHRMHWSADLPFLAVAGDVLFVTGSYVYFAVLRKNSFAGATVQIDAGQQVISTGPYAIVRHPMYDGLLLCCLGIALALGSYWASLLVIPICALVVFRLRNEEALLVRRLPGYTEYCANVRWRLIPWLY